MKTILHGHCIAELRKLPAKHFHVCVTSPPYYGLRSYGTPPQIWDGESDCEHQWGKPQRAYNANEISGPGSTGKNDDWHKNRDKHAGCFCIKCNAWLGELGREPVPSLYVQHLVQVFGELYRVLRDDGIFWLNIGDSLSGGGHGGGGGSMSEWKNQGEICGGYKGRTSPPCWGLKNKDKMLIPHRVAAALQSYGWYVRQDNVWSKPNPMRESVQDRCTTSHEYIFQLAKGQHSIRTIKLLDLKPEFVHFPRGVGLTGSYSGVPALCVQLATSIFNVAQSQENDCLPPFYSKEWEQGAESYFGKLGATLPPMQRAITTSARFLNGNVSTKEFLCEIHSLWCDLGKANELLIRRGMSEHSHPPHAFVDSQTTVAVNDSGKVSKLDIVHGQVIVVTPITCKYFSDFYAIKEPVKKDTIERAFRGRGGDHKNVNGAPGQPPHSFLQEQQNMTGLVSFDGISAAANKLSVWTVTVASFKGAHFATFPPDLIEPCIRAGTSDGGCCAKCGAAFVRVLEKLAPDRAAQKAAGGNELGLYLGKSRKNHKAAGVQDASAKKARILKGMIVRKTVGFKPTCACGGVTSCVPCRVIDPFFGSGTTGQVALTLNRDVTGVELNKDYLPFIQERTGTIEPLLTL